MLSFHVKFVQTDRQTDNGKTICPDLSIWGHKKLSKFKDLQEQLKVLYLDSVFCKK